MTVSHQQSVRFDGQTTSSPLGQVRMRKSEVKYATPSFVGLGDVGDVGA